MTKEQIKTELLKGRPLEKILSLSPGQECMIFIAGAWALTEVVYIPDLDLNGIEYDRDISEDEAAIETIIKECYTGEDIIADFEGHERMAEVFFHDGFLDWAHPSSVYEDWCAWADNDPDEYEKYQKEHRNEAEKKEGTE